MKNITKDLINRLKIEFSKEDKSGVYGYTQRNLAYNSNRIEGSQLTRNQTNSLFETKTLKTDDEYIRSKDIEEMTGHFLMFNEMLKTYDQELSEELIKKYHFQLKSGVFEDKANGYPVGEYKNRGNYVSDIKTVIPEKVSEEMEKLLSSYNSLNEVTLEDIARFHSKYEMIHPFQDGNGRTGRIIIYKECLKNDICPFIIDDNNKQKYYDALHEAQVNENISDLVKYFKEEQENYFNNIKDLIYDYNSLDDISDDDDEADGSDMGTNREQDYEL